MHVSTAFVNCHGTGGRASMLISSEGNWRSLSSPFAGFSRLLHCTAPVLTTSFSNQWVVTGVQKQVVLISYLITLKISWRVMLITKIKNIRNGTGLWGKILSWVLDVLHLKDHSR